MIIILFVIMLGLFLNNEVIYKELLFLRHFQGNFFEGKAQFKPIRTEVVINVNECCALIEGLLLNDLLLNSHNEDA